MIYDGTNKNKCFESLLGDLAKIVRAELAQIGVKASGDDNKVFNDFFAIHKRLIKPKPRKILRSKEFKCPPNLSAKLATLEGKIRNGDDLVPHSSRAIAGKSKSTKPDQMLNDWNIHHLHFEAAGGLNEILFVLITDSTAYEIGIYDHNSWADTELLEIINGNWPNLLDPYRLKGVTDISFSPDSETVKEFRKAQINTCIQLRDGSCYSPPGGGYVADGTNQNAVLSANSYRRYINKILCDIIKDTKNILKIPSLEGRDLSLEKLDDDIYIVITDSASPNTSINRAKIKHYKDFLDN